MQQLTLFPLPPTRAPLPICPCLSHEARERTLRVAEFEREGVLMLTTFRLPPPPPTRVEDAFWSVPPHVHVCPECFEDCPCDWATCDTHTTEEDPHTLRGLPHPCRCCSDPFHPSHPCEICR